MPMLKTCPRCGGLHDINSTGCPLVARVKEPTEASRFRNTYRWRKKRDEVKERDKHLCLVCLIDAFDTIQIYNFTGLEVNHIIPLEELLQAGLDIYIEGLDEDKLLTMCTPHHKLADAGIIPRKLMLDLAAPGRDIEAIARKFKAGDYPPTLPGTV